MADITHNIGSSNQYIRPSLAPQLSLQGPSTVGVVVGSQYQDSGAVTNNRYGYQVLSTVDITTPGEYTVDYVATDLVGRTSMVSRSVLVLQDDNIDTYTELLALKDSILTTGTITQDIDASQLETTALTATGAGAGSFGWEPLGTDQQPRTQTLDGTGKAITNFYINLTRQPDDTSGTRVTANLISHGADIHLSDLNINNFTILSENRRSGVVVGRTHGPVHVTGMTTQGVVSAQHVNAWDTGGVIGEARHPITMINTNVDIIQRSGRFGSGLIVGVIRTGAGDHLFDNVVLHGNNDASSWNQSYMGGAGWHGGINNAGFIGSVATGNTVTMRNFTMFVDVTHYRGPYGGPGGLVFGTFSGEELTLEDVNINGSFTAQSGQGNAVADGSIFGNFNNTTIRIKNLYVNETHVTATNFNEYAGNLTTSTLIDIT